jgi:hypothetical protein
MDAAKRKTFGRFKLMIERFSQQGEHDAQA